MGFTHFISEYGHGWLMELAVLAVLIPIVVSNWKRIIRFSLHNLIFLAVVIWMLGVMLYMLGFAYEGTGHSMFATLSRSFISSLKMFIADDALTDVSKYYKDNAVYMCAFSIVHFLAFCLTLTLAINTIGTRFRGLYLLLKESLLCNRSSRHTYVFWDVNSPSVTLAKDIRYNDSQARIIFLCPYSANSLGENLEMTRVLNADSISDTLEPDDIHRVDSALVVHIKNGMITGRRKAWIKRILDSSSAVDFFFFTEELDRNILLAETLTDNPWFNPRENMNVVMHILTHSSSRQVVKKEFLVLHENDKSNIKWSIVDIESLSVDSLKFNAANYPVNTFPKECIRNGKIDGEYNALFLGMGETGCRMFRFLYEFSMFQGVSDHIIKRRFFLCDNDIDRCAGDLFKDCPGIAESNEVSLLDFEMGSPGFWKLLQDNANNMNSVCISLGNDELALKMTRDVYRHLRHFGTDSKVLTSIFVRVYSQEYMNIFSTLASEYNCAGLRIVPFGEELALFNSGIILRNELMQKVKSFNHCFDIVRGKNIGLSPEECWAADFSVSKYSAMYDNTTVVIDELERRKSQCLSSTFFITTILSLCGLQNAQANEVENLLKSMESAKGASAELIETLTRACYLREKASHMLLGFSECTDDYIKANRKEAVTHKLTSYLLPWQQLSDKSKAMFRDILKTSLQIAKESKSE